PIASAPIGSGGFATLDTGTLTTGSHQIMAGYIGNSLFNGSVSVALPVTGSGLATPSFGATIPYPVLVSTPVTIPISGGGSRGAPTGSITLSEGSTLLSTLALVNGGASFVYSSSIAGTHQIT